jgi:hypothetical protein
MHGKEMERTCFGDRSMARCASMTSKMFSPTDLKVFSKEDIKAARQTAELFCDRKRLNSRVLKALRRSRSLDRKTRDGKSAKDLLAERLAALPGAEFRLLAAFVLAEEVPGLREFETLRWWDAIEDNLTQAGE